MKEKIKESGSRAGMDKVKKKETGGKGRNCVRENETGG